VGAGSPAFLRQLNKAGDISCVNWKNVGVATLTGFAAGFVAPFVAVSLPSAIGLGAVANVANYAATQVVEDFDQ
jgi:hypothetical protein